MKIAYFDCFSGASGNMILGSLIDAGLSVERLTEELRRLPVSGWELRAKRANKRGLSAMYVDVIVPGEDDHTVATAEHRHEGSAHRKLGDVLDILRRAQFPRAVEQSAEKIYRQLATAEGVVHGTTADFVTFHEVGQIDAIIDIAGAALGLHLLGIESVYCSALPCGRGRIASAHGVAPSPAPATLELLRDRPTYQIDLDAEFVTPTGAAILTSLASFDPRPAMSIASIGYGCGRSDFPFPNVLRVIVGDTLAQRTGDRAPDDVVQIETNIDDMSPTLFEHVMERLFAAGALDVWTIPAGMKKGRPGVVLSALAPSERREAVADVMLAETTSIGLRFWNTRRVVAARHMHSVLTSFGPVRVKVVETPAGRRAKPEFEDCRAVAKREGLPLVQVMERLEREVGEHLDAQRI